MCIECYDEEYGAVREDTTEVRLAAEAIDRLYEAHPAGGALHVVVDDWNLEDENLAFCATQEMDEVERACFDALMPLSLSARASALGLHEGFWKPEEAGKS